MKTKIIAYDYAKNEKGELKHISDVTKDNKNNQKFYCLSCGEEMIAKLGDQKCHHFAHKSNCSCSNESYLHKLAKCLIKQTFEKSQKFEIVLLQKQICNQKNECKFFSQEVCCDSKYEHYNLKEYFDKCEEEKEIIDSRNNRKFIADLLLSNSKNGRKLLIEVCVTHQCTNEKKESGLRIIEIPIRDLEDIKRCRSSVWEYTNGEKRLRYYNFKNKLVEPCFRRRQFARILVKKNGTIELKKSISRDDEKSKDSKMELNINGSIRIDGDIRYVNTINKKITIAILRNYGYNVRSCVLCHNHISSKGYCKKSTEFGMNKKPRWDTATYCAQYKESEIKLKDLLQSVDFSDIIVEEVK